MEIEICPKCDELVDFNIYFGAYICDCGWEDRTFNKERCEKYLKMDTISLHR